MKRMMIVTWSQVIRFSNLRVANRMPRELKEQLKIHLSIDIQKNRWTEAEAKAIMAGVKKLG